MGNTVGRQRNISLNQTQQNVLLGTLLGDGTLEKNGKNVRLRVDHDIKQQTYVEWKYSLLCSLATGKIKYFFQNPDKRTNKKYGHCKFDTFSNVALNNFYSIFYANGKKEAPRNIADLLKSPLSLAVWFMDDSYKRNDCNAFRINTDSFSLLEQNLLQQCLQTNFGIKTKIHKKGKYWNIYIPNCHAEKFVDLIKPYIIPQMQYKISLSP